jgi:hypothetical protein
MALFVQFYSFRFPFSFVSGTVLSVRILKKPEISKIIIIITIIIIVIIKHFLFLEIVLNSSYLPFILITSL